ncbi:DUF262 domain-containing protein [Aestuariibaculum suncheonense]|nr:DUF262 domain-containing protein [Aestuariibaculum suncheonense]
MEDLKYSGKTLNFIKLLESYSVEVPIIQRDYAQGRLDQKEIRDNFLDALYGCVSNNEPIKLDFIYGSVVDSQFQPLDGQQRLTTLFLLYWYAATKENKLLNQSTKDLLKKFTYETRISSREFCHELVDKSILIESGISVKQSIVDSNWFFLSWIKDPTIEGMLRTVDDIHKRFYNIENLWNELNSSLIEFYFVELKDMGLTDDLYIKMNARGKLLTPFENFKAGLEKRIIDENWEDNIDLNKSFGVKIDTDWTDFFWDSFRINDSVDSALTRFIATVSMIIQSVERELPTEERHELIRNLQEEPSLVRPLHFNNKGFSLLKRYFDTYHLQVVLHDYENKRLPFPLWRHSPKGSILSMIVFEDNAYSKEQKNSSTYTQKVLFFAQAQYFILNEYNEERYYDWMRVVRNIVSRGDVEKTGDRPDIVRSPSAFDGVINLINELSQGSHNIYEFLEKSTSLKSQFARDQISEERQKARLINYDNNYRELIFKAEDNELLRGKISFVFYCLGYNDSVYGFDSHLFEKITNVFSTYFSSEDSLDNDIRRAILTIDVKGKYEFYTYWWSYWHIGNANKRRLFDKFREIEYFINNFEHRDYFKKFVLKLIDKNPLEIIDEFVPPLNFPNWKNRLIKDSSLLDDQARTNLIAISEDDSYCYLLKSSRPREKEGNILIE